MSPKRRHSPKKKSLRKNRKILKIASSHEALLLKGSKNGPTISGGDDSFISKQELHLYGGDLDCENLDGGNIDGGASSPFQFPKDNKWSWTQFNTTVRQAVENLLYWKPQFKKYFESGSFVIGAFKANSSLIYSERNVVELIVPRTDHYSIKLILVRLLFLVLQQLTHH
jgi:hypothetical protein